MTARSFAGNDDYNVAQNCRYSNAHPMLKAADIIDAVSTVSGASPEGILSPCRRLNFVRPRFLAYYLIREYMDWSWPRIGRFLKRDHNSVHNGYWRGKQLLEIDEEIQRWAKAVRHLLNLRDQQEEEIILMNPYNCPDRVFEMMNGIDANSFLVAIKRLGPVRVQYSQSEKKAPYVNWLLDDRLTSEAEIIAAARKHGTPITQ